MENKKLETISATIGNKKYTLEVAKTKLEIRKGLMKRESLDSDKGMLFDFGYEGTHEMWMYNTPIPLDQIFVNSDLEVIKVVTREPNDEELIGCEGTFWVIEVNANSGIKEGDEVDFEDGENEDLLMKILGPDGKIQYTLEGGERIFSRPNTKLLIKWAKKAELSLSDSDYKHLGKLMFKFLKKQDENSPEYVLLNK